MTKRWFVLYLLFLVVFMLALPPLLRIPFHVYNSYNEGWNAYQVQAVLHQKSLYPTGLVTNNYPPLSFFFLAIVSKVFHLDPLFAGRYVALLSVLGIGCLVVLITRRLTGAWYSSLFAGIFCLGLFVSLGNEYIGLNDPQLLAQFISLLGLYVYLGKDSSRTTGTAFFTSLALFIKHNIVALPLAIGWQLFQYDKKALLKFGLFFLFFSGSLFTLTEVISKGQFLHFLLFSRQYSFNVLLHTAIPVFIKIGLPLVIGAFLSYFARGAQQVVVKWFILAIVISLFFAGGIGVDLNIFFDIFISVSILVGLYVQYVNEQALTIIVTLLFLNIAFALPLKIYHKEYITSIQVEQQEMIADTRLIAKQKDPVICDRLLLCYWAGKQFVYDPFYVDQLIETKKIKTFDIITSIQKHKYSLIEIQDDSKRFPKVEMQAILQYYKVLKHDSNGTFYEPKLPVDKVRRKA